MILHYPERLRWQKSISEDILQSFGSNGKSKITALLKKHQEYGISYTFEPLQENFFDWFIPLYTHRIESKTTPRVHDVYTKTFVNPPHHFPYVSLTLKEAGVPIGGTIFSVREDRVSIAFRAFGPKWQHNTNRCSPALFGEYLVDEYTKSLGLAQLIHGSDTNIYGEHLDIGVAIFKLSVGCNPILLPESVFTSIDTADIVSTKLVFCTPHQGTKINEAVWYTTADNLKKYEQLLKYPDRVTVTVNLID